MHHLLATVIELAKAIRVVPMTSVRSSDANDCFGILQCLIVVVKRTGHPSLRYNALLELKGTVDRMIVSAEARGDHLP